MCGIALASIAWACGSGESKSPPPAAAPAEQGQPAAAAPGQPGAATSGPGQPATGDAVASEGMIPEGYPSDVPVYPGASPGASMAMPGLGVFATFSSADSPQQVQDYYRTELAKGGWSVSDAPDGGGLDGAKGARSVQVRAREDEQHATEIAISYSEK